MPYIASCVKRALKSILIDIDHSLISTLGKFLDSLGIKLAQSYILGFDRSDVGHVLQVSVLNSIDHKHGSRPSGGLETLSTSNLVQHTLTLTEVNVQPSSYLPIHLSSVLLSGPLIPISVTRVVSVYMPYIHLRLPFYLIDSMCSQPASAFSQSPIRRIIFVSLPGPSNTILGKCTGSLRSPKGLKFSE
jgi:hypothetical protein